MSSFGKGDDLVKRALQARLRQGRRGGSSHGFMRDQFLKQAVIAPLVQGDNTPEEKSDEGWQIVVPAMDQDAEVLQRDPDKVSELFDMLTATAINVSMTETAALADPDSELPSRKIVDLKATGSIDDSGSLNFVCDGPGKEPG